MEKLAFVTGGTNGMGLEIVKELCDTNEYDVISMSRGVKSIDSARKYVGSEKVEFVTGDASKLKDINKVTKYIEKKYGKIDVLVNAVGIIHAGGIETVSIEDYKHSMNVNLDSAFMISKACIHLLKNSDYPSILNLSSISSISISSSISYSISKAGLDMLTKAMAKELAKYKIRVNSINPGIVETGFQVTNNMIPESEYPDFVKKVNNQYPLGIGQPSDISKLAMFLISKNARWITGSIYVADGGFLVK